MKLNSLIWVLLLCSVALFAQDKSFYWGPRVSLDMYSVYNTNSVRVQYGSPADKVDHRDPYRDASGVGMNLGLAARYMFGSWGLAAEVNAGLCMLSMDNGLYGRTTYDVMGYAERTSLQENLDFFRFSMPIMYFKKFGDLFYVEVGPQFSLNYVDERTLGEDEEIELGGWEPNLFGVSALLGGGFDIPVGKTKRLDIGGRLVLDFTRLERDSKVELEEPDSFRKASSAKLFAWYSYLAFYL